MREVINIGSSPFDPAAENLQSGGAKINANFLELYSRFNALVSIGEITSEDNVYTVPAGAVWNIAGLEYTNALPFIFTIVPATDGFRRIDLLIVRPEGFELIQGTESDGTVNPPDIPDAANALEIKPYFSDGATVDDGEPPITGNDYVKRSDLSETAVLEDGITTLNVPAKTGGARFSGNCPSFDGFYVDDQENLWPGKPFRIKNWQASSMVLKHSPTGPFLKMFFPNGQDLRVEAGEIIEFEWGYISDGMSSARAWQLRYVGRIGAAKRSYFILFSPAAISMSDFTNWYGKAPAVQSKNALAFTAQSALSFSDAFAGDRAHPYNEVVPFSCRVKNIWSELFCNATGSIPIEFAVKTFDLTNPYNAGAPAMNNQKIVGHKTVTQTASGLQQRVKWSSGDIDSSWVINAGACCKMYAKNNFGATAGTSVLFSVLVEFEEA